MQCQMGLYPGQDFITKPFHVKEVMVRVETHLKMADLQQKLRTETARFKTLAGAAFEAILIHSAGVIVDANAAAARLFQRSEAALIGAELVKLLPPEFHRRVLSGQPAPFEGDVIGRDDNRIPVEFRAKILPLEDQPVGETAIRGLTRQKRMEQEREQLGSSSDTAREPLPMPSGMNRVFWRPPTEVLFFSMKSASSPSPCK